MLTRNNAQLVAMAAIGRSQLPRELLTIIQQPLHHFPPRPSLALQRSPRALSHRANLSTTSRLHGSGEPASRQLPPQSSVDPAEITHFNALASSWWDPHGPSRLLHLMNPLRHTFITSCLSDSGSGSGSSRPARPAEEKLHYLDIGCGGGIFAESAARLRDTASVTAVDPSPAVLRVAEAHRRQDPLLLEPGRLKYHNAAIEDLPADRVAGWSWLRRRDAVRGAGTRGAAGRVPGVRDGACEARRLARGEHDCAHDGELDRDEDYGGGCAKDGAEGHARLE